MCSFPVALVLGILGIVFDRRKILAIIATIIAAAFVLFYLSVIIIGIVVSASR
ncbi:MAG: hypothetical protein NTX52_07445 [Planctomycetota bacterium]|nr:hypothetical protein [Planctomycetota bacterium]